MCSLHVCDVLSQHDSDAMQRGASARVRQKRHRRPLRCMLPMQRNLDSFFGAPATNTRSGGKKNKRCKETKVLQRKLTKTQAAEGKEGGDYDVKNQQLQAVPATNALRSRTRVGTKSLKKPTKLFAISFHVAEKTMRMHPDVFEWIKDEETKQRYLQCKYCKHILNSKFAAAEKHVNRHVKSPKHARCVSQWQEQEAKKQSLFDVMKLEPLQRKTVSDATNVFRGNCVAAFLSAGIPLNKIEVLRPFLEHHCNAKLDDVSNLRKVYLPVLRQAMRKEVNDAIAGGCKVCLIHDGTNRFSEFYSVIIRWCTPDFNLEERLVAMKAFVGAQKGQQLAVMVDDVLTDCGVSKGGFRESDGAVLNGGLLAINRDRAMVNTKATKIVSYLYQGMMDLECLPHTFNKVGEKMPLTQLTKFRDDLLIALNSQAFKAHCMAFIDKPIRKPSATRWWSTWELYSMLLSDMLQQDGSRATYFDRLLQAFRDALNPRTGAIDLEGVHADSVRVLRLVEFAQTVDDVEYVLLELAVTVGVFRPFVQATYALEGAGCCVLEVGVWFEFLSTFWAMHEPTLSFPKVRDTIESMAAARFARGLHPDHAAARSHLETHVRNLIQPVEEQLQFVFNARDGELHPDVQFYKFCATLNPFAHGRPEHSMQPDVFKASVLQYFGGWFTETPADVDGMIQELPQFALECVSFVADNAPELPGNDPDKLKTSAYRNVAIWKFWKRLDRQNRCPKLRRLAQLVLSIAPSSAAAERSFSLLKAYFTAQQLVGDHRGALEDYIELTIAQSFADNNKKNAFHGSGA